MDINTLPFPKVYTEEELLVELRKPKEYDETAFLEQFCRYDGPDASKKLCDAVLGGWTGGLKTALVPDNGKKNILLYVGNLARNGITQSVKNLLSCVDYEENNYIITFMTNKIRGNESTLKEFPEQVSYISMTGTMQMTLKERFLRERFIGEQVSVKRYMETNRKRLLQEWRRNFSGIRIDSAIHFNGYEQETILLFSQFPGKSAIFVHNDMVNEISTKKNQRKDVLKYAYRTYDTVAVVTEDLISSTASFTGGDVSRIRVCKNVIDYRLVKKKAEDVLSPSSVTEFYPSENALRKILASNCRKFISIGRFSPEKGHFRLLDAFARLRAEEKDIVLVIIGGVSNFDYYKKTIERIEEFGLQDCVVLVKNLANPYVVLKQCDYFVLSSFYEGFGLVLAEADILGKPVVCTDIVGPRAFMKRYGGQMVPDNEEGVYGGMKAALAGEIAVMDVDYEKYNREAVQEFYSLL